MAAEHAATPPLVEDGSRPARVAKPAGEWHPCAAPCGVSLPPGVKYCDQHEFYGMYGGDNG